MVEESTSNPPPDSPPDSPPDLPPDSACTRCVVLVGPGGTAPTDLLGGLSRRGVGVQVVAEPAGVMVELARRRVGALIVIEPEQQPGLTDLIEAVTVYHPRTVRWGYQSAHPTGKAQLQPLNGRSVGDATGLDPQPVPLPGEPAHAARVAMRSPLGHIQAQVPPERVRSLIVKVQGPAKVGEPLISEEELAMLLGPVPQKQGGEP